MNQAYLMDCILSCIYVVTCKCKQVQSSYFHENIAFILTFIDYLSFSCFHTRVSVESTRNLYHLQLQTENFNICRREGGDEKKLQFLFAQLAQRFGCRMRDSLRKFWANSRNNFITELSNSVGTDRFPIAQ